MNDRGASLTNHRVHGNIVEHPFAARLAQVAELADALASGFKTPMQASLLPSG
jgi:hypothetical protein